MIKYSRNRPTPFFGNFLKMHICQKENTKKKRPGKTIQGQLLYFNSNLPAFSKTAALRLGDYNYEVFCTMF